MALSDGADPARLLIQECLAHNKPRPLKPQTRNIPRAVWWCLGGGGGSYERGNPVKIVVLGGGAFSDERGTPVKQNNQLHE